MNLKTSLTQLFPCSNNRIITHLNDAISVLAAINWVFITIHCVIHPINWQQAQFLFGFSLVSVLLLLFWRASFTATFLLSTFTLITTWRLSCLAHLMVPAAIYAACIVIKFSEFIYLCYKNIHASRNDNSQPRISVFEWQLYFIRLYIGCDLIPHFSEKLFAGPAVRQDDITAFVHLGVPHATAFVLLAGLIEFFGALAISTGFLTRIAAIGLVAYLMIASYLGHHFTLGFIWANAGGGWEYPVLWSAVILSFAGFGAGRFSLDYLLKKHCALPRWIKVLMGERIERGATSSK